MTRRAAASVVGLLLVAVVALAACSAKPEEDDDEALPRPAPAERLPGRLVDTIGLASFNEYRHLPRRA